MIWINGVDGQANVTGSTLVQSGVDANGYPTYTGNPGTPGYDVILDTSVVMPLLLSGSIAWLQYQVKPPLTRTWSGDDPTNPTQTIELQFPDLATAQSVLPSFWAVPPPQVVA